MNAGDTFFLRGPENPRPHLWLVLSDPSLDPANVVIVNFTSDGSGKEQTCVLVGGSHPCLPHDSCVNYSKSRILSDQQLERAKAMGALDPQVQLESTLLRRIQGCSAESDDMPNKHRQVLIDQSLCDPA